MVDSALPSIADDSKGAPTAWLAGAGRRRALATPQSTGAGPGAQRVKAWLLALALALAAPAAHGQSAKPASPAASQPPVEAIAIGDIPAQADAVDRWAQDVDAEMQARPDAATRELLERTDQEISRRQAALVELPSGSAAARALSSARAAWDDLDGRLGEAQDGLQRAADGLDLRLREARERSERWRLTADDARSAGVPAAVMSDVQEAQATLARERSRIELARNDLLELEARVRTQRRTVQAARERVVKLRGELRGRLLERTDQPLWRLRPVRDAGAELRRLADTLARMGGDIADYAGRARDRLLVELALIAFLIWAAARGRRFLRRGTGAEESRANVLAHPVSVGLLAGLTPVRALNPEAPYGFLALVGAIGLVPWLRVLSGLLPPSLRAPLRWLAVLVLLDTVRGVIHGVPLFSRVLLLLELGLAVAVVARLRRPQQAAAIPRFGGRAGQRCLDLWLRLSLLALGAAIPAAVFGYGELASVLAGTAVLGSFVGTVFIVVVLLLELLLHALVDAGLLDRVQLIRSYHGPLLRAAGWVLRAAAGAAWVYLVLDYTTFGDLLWPWLARVLATPIGYGSISLTLGGVIAFVTAIWGSWLLSRLATLVLDTEVFPHVSMPPGIPFALATFTRYAVLCIGFIIALGLIGFSLDRVTILLGALGVGVGFGLQNVVNNFVSGVILLFERPIRVGDRIQLEQLVGDVTRIGMRASRVRTLDGIDLIVPNADFISARVANWTLADTARRVTVAVGVAYGTRPERVLELLDRVARSHPDVLDSPEPEMLFQGFGDSSLDFQVRVWTHSGLVFRVHSDLAVATYNALEKAGISIPFPQRDLHLRSVSPEARSALAPGSVEDGEG